MLEWQSALVLYAVDWALTYTDKFVQAPRTESLEHKMHRSARMPVSFAFCTRSVGSCLTLTGADCQKVEPPTLSLASTPKEAQYVACESLSDFDPVTRSWEQRIRVAELVSFFEAWPSPRREEKEEGAKRRSRKFIARLPRKLRLQ